MSIIKKNNKVILSFGKGDINIAGHGDKDFSFVSFKNIEPREIGVFREGNGEVTTLEKSIEESEVVMTFSNRESLNALIYMLNVMKEKMDENKERD
ncbi:MAG: hypothetical protein NSGCLCUN01_02723 [uncultured Clostridium sp.]